MALGAMHSFFWCGTGRPTFQLLGPSLASLLPLELALVWRGSGGRPSSTSVRHHWARCVGRRGGLRPKKFLPQFSGSRPQTCRPISVSSLSAFSLLWWGVSLLQAMLRRWRQRLLLHPGTLRGQLPGRSHSIQQNVNHQFLYFPLLQIQHLCYKF